MDWKRQTNDGSFEVAEKIFGGFIPLILIIFGTIGNAICIVYLVQSSFRRSRSTNIYLICLFAVDTLSLYQWNLNHAVMELGHHQPLSEKSLFLCRSVAFLSFYTLHLSALFLSLVCLDRTLLLWSHTYRRAMAKRRYTYVIVALVVIALFGLNCFILLSGFVDENTHQVICYVYSNTDLMMFYTNVYPWIHLVMMYILPFIIMLIGMTLIIVKLHSRRTRTRLVGKKHRLSWMLVGMCAVYMVLTLPNRLCFSVFLSSILNHTYTDTVLLASNSLLYTRNATNIVFLLISSASFRKTLSQLFRDRLCWHCRPRGIIGQVVPVQGVPVIVRLYPVRLPS